MTSQSQPVISKRGILNLFNVLCGADGAYLVYWRMVQYDPDQDTPIIEE